MMDAFPAKFQCTVEGSPFPEIYWFRHTTVIKKSEELVPEVTKGGVCSLLIREVFPEDAGMFTIVAKNQFGFVTASAQLIVERK